MSSKKRSQDLNPGLTVDFFSPLFFIPINAFCLVPYPYFEDDKPGGQRRAGTHFTSSREQKAEPDQNSGVLATSWLLYSIDPALD